MIIVIYNREIAKYWFHRRLAKMLTTSNEFSHRNRAGHVITNISRPK